MRKTLMILMAALGVSLVTGACGDDEVERLTQAEFVEQGNAICKAGNDRIEAAGEDLFGDATEENPPPEEAVTSFIEDTLIPEVEKQIDDIDALNPPEDIEGDVDAAIAEARAALQRIKDDPAQAAGQDEDPFAEANEMIGEVGLTTCAES